MTLEPAPDAGDRRAGALVLGPRVVLDVQVGDQRDSSLPRPSLDARRQVVAADLVAVRMVPSAEAVWAAE